MRAEEARCIEEENREPRYRSLLIVVLGQIRCAAELGKNNTYIECDNDLVGRLTTEIVSLGYSVDIGYSVIGISWAKNEN